MQRIIVGLALAAGLLAFGYPQTARAQQEPGILQGRILDVATGEPLIGAQVSVVGSDQGAVTDVDGRYRISLPAGNYDLRVVYLGYTDKTVTGVPVRSDAANYQDITLASEAIEAEGIEVVISAAEERGSVAGALAYQRRATNVVNGISAEEIGRTPASDAADAIKRVTSTSIVGGKYVYVRGLGERYSTAQLDGAALPTPEPEKRVLPLDIFPASMIESLFTVKSYTADLPGDFAGGLVDIQTKDIPDRPFFTMSTGVGYNTNLGDIDRPRYEGGGLDWLGFDDGTRSIPDGLPARIPASATDSEVAELHSLFEGDFQAFTDPVDFGDVNKSFSLSFGSPVGWFGREGGYLLGVSYSNNVNSRLQAEFYPSLEAGNFQYDYDTELGTREVSLAALGGYSLNLTPTSRFSLKTIFTQSSEDETRLVAGPFNQSTNGFGRIHRFQFVERTLLSNQARFEHKAGFFGDSKVEWSGSYALTLRDEPDTRQTSYVAPREGETFFFNEAGSNNRFFSELTDHMGQGEVKLSSQFDLFGRRATLDTGTRASYRTREFSARRFAYDNASPGGRTLPPTELFTSANIAAGNIDFFENTEPTDAYDGTEATAAGYASLGIGLSDAFRATAGVRVEWDEIEVDTFDPRSGSRVTGLSRSLSTVEPLPTVTLQYDLTETHSLRAAAARTIVRPQFRELAPFRYENYLESTLGNPFLENGEIINLDLRWSWFPALGEIVSVGGFYKRLNDPIEIVRLPTAGNNVGTPEPYNGPSASTYGVEFEVRNELGRWTPLTGLSASSNITLATSNVKQDEPIEVYFGNPSSTEPDILSPEIFTNEERPLYHQSPYLVNTSLHYLTGSGRSSATLLYNLVGERLTQVGTNGFDDIYEATRYTLDATLEHRLMDAVEVKLSATNLSDTAIVYELGSDETLRYEPGRSVSVKASYSF
jgi:outer membrane receptor protein involved in Fe transport